MFGDVIPREIHTVIYMYAHQGFTEFLGTMVAILGHFENGGHFEAFKGHQNCRGQLSIAIRVQIYH
jgi:hypothetical protein